MPATATCGVKPTKVSVAFRSELPVLPATGRPQRSGRPVGGAAVALPVRRLLADRAAGRVGRRPGPRRCRAPAGSTAPRRPPSARRASVTETTGTRRAPGPLGGHRGVRVGQVERGGGGDAEGERAPVLRVVPGEARRRPRRGADAEPLRHLHHPVRADLLGQPDEVGVHRAAEASHIIRYAVHPLRVGVGRAPVAAAAAPGRSAGVAGWRSRAARRSRWTAACPASSAASMANSLNVEPAW